MPRFICTTDCLLSGQFYKAGQVVEASATPSATYFSAFNSDLLFSQAGGAQIDLDETYYFPRTGWDDIKYPAVGINPPGAASDPTRDTTDGTLVFSATQQNIITYGSILPHGKKIGTMVEPHIHFQPTGSGTGNVIWRFEYCIAPVNTLVPGFTTLEITVPIEANTNGFHLIATFGLIDLLETDVAVLFKWRLSRMGNLAGDTYAATVKLEEFDIHAQFDSLGSGRVYNK